MHIFRLSWSQFRRFPIHDNSNKVGTTSGTGIVYPHRRTWVSRRFVFCGWVRVAQYHVFCVVFLRPLSLSLFLLFVIILSVPLRISVSVYITTLISSGFFSLYSIQKCICSYAYNSLYVIDIKVLKSRKYFKKVCLLLIYAQYFTVFELHLYFYGLVLSCINSLHSNK